MAANLLRSLSSEALLAGTTKFKTFGVAAGILPKVSSARRRRSEFNVFGDGDIVSVDFLLQNLKAAQEDKALTKLELEDLVRNGPEERDTVVFLAVSNMLKNDGDRRWVYIKFIDSLRVGNLGEGLDGLRHYEKERQALWDHIQGDAVGKPITFRLKLEIEEDTPVSTIIEVLNEVLACNLSSIEFLGGLYGYKAPEIGDALAQLCKPDNPEETSVLKEMVMLNLNYLAGDRDKSHASGRDRVWKKVLRRCIRRLGGETRLVGEALSLGDSEHSLGSSRSEPRSRARSPKGDLEDSARDRSRSLQGRTDIDLMRAAIVATRVRSPKRVPAKKSRPELRRAVSELMTPPSHPSDLSGGTPLPGKKRRKPRSFATLLGSELDDSGHTSEDDFCGNSTGSRKNEEWKAGDKKRGVEAKRECKDLQKLLHPGNSLRRSHASAVQDVTVEGVKKREARSKKEDNSFTKPLNPKRGVGRAHTSPMQKRDHVRKVPDTASVKRSMSSSSTKTKQSPRESKGEDEEGNHYPKSITSRRKGQPSYDWDKHSSNRTPDNFPAKSA